jgi:hypothetical protein
MQSICNDQKLSLHGFPPTPERATWCYARHAAYKAIYCAREKIIKNELCIYLSENI